MPEIMTFNEAVKAAGVNPRTLRREIERGHLKATEAEGTLLILMESFKEWHWKHLPGIELTRRLGIGKLMKQRALERKVLAAANADEGK